MRADPLGPAAMGDALPLWGPLLQSLVAGLATTVGGLAVYCLPAGAAVPPRLIAGSLAFAAGVMTTVSILDLWLPVARTGLAAATLATLDLPPCGNSPAAASGVATPRSTLDGGAALGEAALPFDWSAAPHAPTFLITGAPRGAASSPQGWARGWRGDHLLLGGSAQPHDICPSPGTLAAALQGPGEARQTPITRAATETPAASTLLARVAALEAGIQTPHSQQLPASSAEGAAASASSSAAAQARRLRAVARMAIAPRPQPGPLSPTSAAQERAMTRASVLALRLVWSAAALATQPPAASPVLPRRAPKAAASPPAWPPRAACASAGGVSSSEPAVPRSPAVFTRFSPGRLQEEACILSPSPALPDKLYATPARQRSFGTNVTNSRSPSLEGLAALATMR